MLSLPRGFRISPGLLFYNGNQLTAPPPCPVEPALPQRHNLLLGQCEFDHGRHSRERKRDPGPEHHQPASPSRQAGQYDPRNGHGRFRSRLASPSLEPSVNVNLGGWACYDPAQTECTTSPAPQPDCDCYPKQPDRPGGQVDQRSEPAEDLSIVSAGVATASHPVNPAEDTKSRSQPNERMERLLR